MGLKICISLEMANISSMPIFEANLTLEVSKPSNAASFENHQNHQFYERLDANNLECSLKM